MENTDNSPENSLKSDTTNVVPPKNVMLNNFPEKTYGSLYPGYVEWDAQNRISQKFSYYLIVLLSDPESVGMLLGKAVSENAELSRRINELTYEIRADHTEDLGVIENYGKTRQLLIDARERIEKLESENAELSRQNEQISRKSDDLCTHFSELKDKIHKDHMYDLSVAVNSDNSKKMWRDAQERIEKLELENAELSRPISGNDSDALVIQGLRTKNTELSRQVADKATVESENEKLVLENTELSRQLAELLPQVKPLPKNPEPTPAYSGHYSEPALLAAVNAVIEKAGELSGPGFANKFLSMTADDYRQLFNQEYQNALLP